MLKDRSPPTFVDFNKIQTSVLRICDLMAHHLLTQFMDQEEHFVRLLFCSPEHRMSWPVTIMLHKYARQLSKYTDRKGRAKDDR